MVCSAYEGIGKGCVESDENDEDYVPERYGIANR